MNKRRRIVLLIGASVLGALFAVPYTAFAQQQPKPLRIGYLTAIAPNVDLPRLEAFRRGLRELGYIEGQTVSIELRSASGQIERLPEMAAELVQLGVSIFVTTGTPATVAAKNAGGNIPIVFFSVTDPVAAGLVDSLARPRGTITGFTNIAAALAGKRLELLKETVPKLSRVAVLWDSRNSGSTPQWQQTERPARGLGLQRHSIEVSSAENLDAGFKAAVTARSGALVVTLNPLFVSKQAQIAELAMQYRLPVIYPDRTFVDAGGLMSYGPPFADIGRDGARYVDKIHKGAKPGDLPVEQPREFELVINMKTAKALGIKIPQSILLRADKVIE